MNWIKSLFTEERVEVPKAVAIENGKWTVHGKPVNSSLSWGEMTLLDEKITGR